MKAVPNNVTVAGVPAKGGRRGRLPRAVARHGPDAVRRHARRLIQSGGACAGRRNAATSASFARRGSGSWWTLRKIRKLDACLKKLFGNALIPAWCRGLWRHGRGLRRRGRSRRVDGRRRGRRPLASIFRMVIQVGSDLQRSGPVPTLRRLSAAQVRQRESPRRGAAGENGCAGSLYRARSFSQRAVRRESKKAASRIFLNCRF